MIDTSGLPFAKSTPRVVDRLARKKDLAKQERECRATVKRRDKGKCVIPGCKDASRHLHHITYRSKGGKWRTGNIASLCVKHHQFVHAALIHIDGDADVHLTITGDMTLLRFKP